jgi:hypothetical protein
MVHVGSSIQIHPVCKIESAQIGSPGAFCKKLRRGMMSIPYYRCRQSGDRGFETTLNPAPTLK